MPPRLSEKYDTVMMAIEQIARHNGLNAIEGCARMLMCLVQGLDLVSECGIGSGMLNR